MSKISVRMRMLEFVLCALVLPSIVWGQTGSATLSGTVYDQTGAVVAGAEVVATNVATGVQNKLVTNSAGLYVIPHLSPGTYNLTASANGFVRETMTDIPLQVDQVANVDVHLKVGSATQAVTVTGANEAQLQTETSNLGSVITTQQVTDLPLNGRYFTELMVLSPGTVPANNSDMFGGSNPVTAGMQRNGTPAYDVSGSQGAFAQFRIDGSENTEREFGGSNVPISVDAIQEFKLQTSNFSAEYGRSPIQVDIVTKSGTNAFHGGAYEFVRNDVFDATQWNFNGLKIKNNLKRNQFGGTLGGPIKKDKLFFFFNYEGNRQIFSEPLTETLPSAAMRAGVFPSGVEVFDPSTGAQFPNNTIPSTEWNPITQKVINMVLPLPNVPGQQTLNNAGFALDPVNNYVFNPQERIFMNQYNGRVDYTLSNKDRIFARYTYSPLSRYGEGPLATNIQSSLVNAENANLGGTNLSANWAHTLSPTTVNQFTFAFDTDPSNYGTCDTIGGGSGCHNTNWAQVLGVAQFLPSNAFIGLPHFEIGSGVNLGSGDYRPLQTQEHNFQFVDNFSVVHGNHFLQMGADIRRTQLSTQNSENSKGQFYSNGAQTRNRTFPTTNTTYCPGGTVATACTSGDAMGDFLLGDLDLFQDNTPIPPLSKYFSNWAFYGNDTWHVTKKLTFNLGLRYEYQTMFHADPESYAMPIIAGNMFTGKVAIAQTGNGSISPRFQTAANQITPGAFEGCTAAGLPSNCLVSYKKAFQPRVGFAWQLNQKTVLRGAFGVFYSYFEGDLATEDGELYPMIIGTVTPTQTTPPATGPAPLNISNPLSLSMNPTPELFATDPYRKLPSTNEWNLSLERQVMSNTTFTISYVGSASEHLDDGAISSGEYYYNIPGPTGVVLAPGQKQVAPQPTFGEVIYGETKANAHYEAMQSQLSRRFSDGLQLTVNYTYSKNIDEIPWQSDPLDYRLDHGPDPDTPTHNFLISPIYDLPFGSGKRFVNTKGPLNQIIGGWRLTGIMAWRSGYPYTPLLSVATPLLGYSLGVSQNRPNRICNGSLSNASALQWFNKSCFTAPVEPTTPGAALIPGNSGPAILQGPGQFSFDSGISKTFPITERVGLDFRAEFFNILNHPTLGLPNATILPAGNSAPSEIVNPSSLPRIVQFALKLHF